jgi:hypothetical protein
MTRVVLGLPELNDVRQKKDRYLAAGENPRECPLKSLFGQAKWPAGAWVDAHFSPAW